MTRDERPWSAIARLLAALAVVATALVLAPQTAARAGAIQDAIDAAPPGGTVAVPEGAFVEDLTITKDLTLTGAGAGISVVEGTGEGPVVTAVATGVDLTITGLTITGGVGTDGGGIRFGGNGTLTLDGVALTGNAATRGGGLFAATTKAVTITDTTFSGNAATGDGGAMRSGSPLTTVTGGVVTGNVAGGNGGGFAVTRPTTLTSVTSEDNHAGGDGGAVWAVQSVTIERGVFSANSSEGEGGGVWAETLAMSAATVAGNTSGNAGGGIHFHRGTVDSSAITGNNAVRGGGIADHGLGTSSVTNSTVSGNTAAEHGGGIHYMDSASGLTSVNNVTVAFNDAGDDGGGVSVDPGATGTMQLSNTIVAVNDASGSGPDCDGALGDLGHNLLGAGEVVDPTGGTAAGCGLVDGVDGNQVGYLADPLDPTLGPLTLDGATESHPLLAGSPAIDAGNPAEPASGPGTCEPVSQNGVTRAAGSCDIGAFEVAGSPTVTVAVTVDDPNPPVAVSSIPVTDIPATALTIGAAANQESVIATTDISEVDSSPIGSIPVNSIPIGSIPIGSIPIDSIAGDTLGSVLLVDVPVEGGWPTLLAGSALTGPLQGYTLFDVFADPVAAANIAAADLDIDQLGLAATPIGSIPVVAVGLGSLPIGSIPIGSIDPNDPTAVLTAWCDLLAGSPADCDAIGVDPADPATADGVNMLSLSLAAAPIDSIPIGSIPIGSIPIGSIPIGSIPIGSIWVAGTPIGSIRLVGTPINSIPIGSIPIGSIPIGSIPIGSIPIGSIELIVDCAVYDCAGGAAAGDSIGDIPAEAWTGTYGQLLQVLTDAGQLAGFTLPDLLTGLPDDTSLADLFALLLPAEDYPWQALDLDAARLAAFATDPTTVTYTASIALATGAAANDATVTATLPAGSVYQSGSTVITPPVDPGQTEPVVDGDTLTWTLTGLPDGPTTLFFAATTGLDLGPTATTVAVDVTSAAVSASGTAALTVHEAIEPNDTPATAVPAALDTIHLSHVGSATDLDFFLIEDVPAGATITAVLGSLPDDFDLVLYSPTGTPLRGEPERRVTGVEDEMPDLLDPPEGLPEVLADIPLEDLPIEAVSTNRSTATEVITVGPVAVSGDYLVQVSGYSAASNVSPYTARFTVDPAVPPGACEAVPLTGGTPGTLPATLPTGVNTLFLVNQQRFSAAHGSAAMADALAAMQRVAGATWLGVTGAVIPVEGDPAVAAAFDAWDADPCSVDTANGAASAVAALVDGYRRDHPGIEYVVLVGGDDQIPQFRIPDETLIANETGYATSLGSRFTPQRAAMASRTILTDDPYGDANPLLANGREIYVPEVALGRLVESPQDIVGALDNYLAFNGLLDPATTSAAFVSGYDFLTDGARQVSDAIAAGGRPVTDLISETWTVDDLADGLLSGEATLAAVNAHFDHNRAEPADASAGLFTTGDVTDSGPATLSQAVLFSMGCHSGLSVSDIQIGADPLGTDWPQTMAAQGAVYAGNTGFGYGETETVALSEQLMAYFADGLDGGVTVGRALQLAKHRYAGGDLLFGGYDDKVLMISTFYGLPFFRVGGDGTISPPPPAPPLSVDGVTGLTVAEIVTDLPLADGLVRVETDRGSYFAADTGSGQMTQVTPFRPVQPRVEVDVTQGGGLIAHGALITGLTSEDIPGFGPVVARPTVDLTANEPEPVTTGQFPSQLQAVNRFLAASGDRDQLVLVPGQFRATGVDIGVQRLFTTVATQVLYSADTVGDFAAPVVRSTAAVEVSGGITFDVRVDDADGAVVRVLVLFHDAGGSGAWTPVDLIDQGDGRWSGAATATAGVKEYYVQAVDDSGNVAVGANKGELFLTQPEIPPGDIIQLSGNQVEGWFDGPVTVELTAPPAVIVAYDLNGAGLVPYEGAFEVTGDGVHVVTALASDGTTDSATIPVDALAPEVTSPIDGAHFAIGAFVPVSFTCNDAGSGIASCVGSLSVGDPLPTLADGSFTVTATDRTGKQTVATISWTVGDTPAADIVEDLDQVVEGTVVTLTGSSDVSDAAFAWVVLRDGGLLATGDQPSLTFVADDDGAYRVELTVRTADGLVSGIAVEELTAVNVSPTITATGEPVAAVGDPYPLTIGPVLDPGTDNAFRYEVHWGDGTSDSTTVLGTLEHTYTTSGPMSISVDVTDEDGTFLAAGGLDVVVIGGDPPPPSCDVADATIIGTNGNDMLIGTPGDDIVWAGPGKDILLGMGGDDVLCGGGSTDTLMGGAGNDTLVGEPGNDLLLGNDGNDQLLGRFGHDTIEGGDGDDIARGGFGHDDLSGGPGTDLLDGGKGNDSCVEGETVIACED